MELITQMEPILDVNSETENKLNTSKKRQFDTCTNSLETEIKRQKSEISGSNTKTITTKTTFTNDLQQAAAKQTQLNSPKKRLDLATATTTKPKHKYIYGNYSQYYGYRISGKDNHDVRLDVFATRAELLRNKELLDIGCNNGTLTMELAQRFQVKSIVGLDIDRGLINRANKQLIAQKKSKPLDNPDRSARRYPYNVSFIHGNYVLRDDVLLEIEREQFDVVLCLSITKWIQLNFGDAGLKQAFRRMYLQLRAGGKLILEAQPYDNYGRRKQLTQETHANYKAMQFFPVDFTDYLLSAEVGFASVELFGVPEHVAVGFKRPIQIFFKS